MLKILCKDCEQEIEFDVRGFEVWAIRCECQDNTLIESTREEERESAYERGKEEGYSQGYDDGCQETEEKLSAKKRD